MPSESDALIVQQIRAGDESAWKELINRYEQRLLKFAELRLRDHSMCEDVVQETFIGFHNSLPHYDERRELQTYLFTIAHHKITDRIRKISREQNRTAEGGESLLPGQNDPRQRGASSVARSDERREMERIALARALRGVLKGYQDKHEYLRIKVLELLFVRGMQNCHVARQLDVSEQQVANFRFAAVKKIKDDVRNAGLSPDVFPELQGAED